MVWSLLALLVILWDNGHCQGAGQAFKWPVKAGSTIILPPPLVKRRPYLQPLFRTPTTRKYASISAPVRVMPLPAANACGLAKVDLVIVLDASTSVTEPNYKRMLSFCKDFLKDADIDSGSVRVGLVIYSTDVQIQFHLNRHSTKDAVFQAIDKVPYIYGSTNTADGLKTMRTQMFTQANGDRPDVSNLALVMTDGISNINARRTIPEAEQAHRAGIHIYAIGIGLSDTNELNAIATPPARENSVSVQDFNELAGLAVTIFSSICPVKTSAPAPVTTQSTLSTTTTLPTTTTNTRTTTRTSTTLSTTTIESTTAKPLVACGLTKVDLVFILDASTSVTEANYRKMLNFCKDVIGNADIDSGSVRVGVVIYSTHVSIQFHLNRYSKKTDLLAAIDQIPYIYGSTNTADGLRTMRTEMFIVTNGDRPEVDNVAVIITDGISNINARRTVPEAIQARAIGIHIYAIGVGLTDSKELDAIASEPAKENSFSIQEFDELVGLENKIFTSICLEHGTATPTSTPPTTTSTTTTEATTLLTVETRSIECELSKVDLVFVLDASTSVTEANFVKTLNFVKSFLAGADVDNGNVRVGALIYSTEVNIQFYLNEYSEKASMFKAIEKIPYIYGSTNTADGLEAMHYQMFREDKGDRPDVPNVAMVITDGISNINARRTIPEAKDARAAGIHIYAVGIGLVDDKELRGIASEPADDNTLAVQNFDELAGLEKRIFTSICAGETSTACADAQVDFVYILDASTSVTDVHFAKMLDFCKQLVEEADIDNGHVQVGVVVYSSDVRIEFHLNSYKTKSDVMDAIGRIKYTNGSTNTADGLKTMREEMFSFRNGDRPVVPNVAIILTNGVSNINARRTIPEAEQARAEGIHIYAIGIGLPDTRELDAIASQPASENSFSVRTFDDLKAIKEKVFSSLCPGETTRTTTTCGLAKVDLVFILDASTSVTEVNYKKMLNFCKDFLGNADIDSGSVRVGVVIYSTHVSIQFHLNRYSKKTDLLAAIDQIPYIYGSTNTADGLKTMRTEMFTVANGDRPEVDNVAVIITDGISNINARRTVPEAVQARAIGIHIYAIGIGLTDSKELDAIASEPANENSFSIQEFDELVGLENKILTSICQETVPPPGVYECESSKVDLVFVLDASTSLTEATFVKMLNFVKSFLAGFNVDNGDVRVGAHIFSTEASIHFHLNEYSDKASLFKAIENIPYVHGSTSTADGLVALYYRMFTIDKGDRPDVPNVVVVITDDLSNINAGRDILKGEDARAAGIHIYAIFIGLVDDKDLRGTIFKLADENTFVVQNFDNWEGLEKGILTSICPELPPVERGTQLPRSKALMSTSTTTAVETTPATVEKDPSPRERKERKGDQK